MQIRAPTVFDFHYITNICETESKVPKYLGEKWLSSPQSEVGKLQIRRLGARPEVTFKLNQNLAAMGESQAPIDHKLILSAPSKTETLGILSRFTNDEDTEVRSIEGSIVQNAGQG